MEDYKLWNERNTLAGHLSTKQPDGTLRPMTENEKAQMYIDKMKSRSGFRKFMDNVGTSLVAGGGDLVTAALGVGAMATGAVQAATGLHVGAETLSGLAAANADNSQKLVQSHDITGTTEGFGGHLIGGVARALPGMTATIVSGGMTSAMALGAAQTGGTQYAQTYAKNIEDGMSHDQAFAKSAPAAVFSAAMSAALTKAFPGGVTALNSGAVRSTLSTGANRAALNQGMTQAIKAYAATTARGAAALARGALDEIPQEVLDEGVSQLSSAYAEGRDPKQAVTDFLSRLPQIIATSGVLGAAGEHIAQSRTKQAKLEPQIPPNTTQDSTLLPVPTFNEASEAKQTIDKLKAQDGPLSAEQQQALDGAEKVFARKTEDNILHQKAGIEKRGGTLHPTTVKALADARAVLARPGPGGNQEGSSNADNTTSYHEDANAGRVNGMDANTTDGRTPGQMEEGQLGRLPSSGQPPQTTANDRQPSQTSPLPPPRTRPLSVEQSRRLIENVSKMPARAQQHPQVQADLAQAQRVVAGNTQLGEASSQSQAALFDSVPGVEKTREMRVKENAYLRKHAIPRRSPPSKNVTTATRDAHDLAMQKAALLQDDVHDGLGMRPVMMGQNVSDWRNAGEYRKATAVRLARIHVSPDTGTPLLTSLHELGHHVDLHLEPMDVAAVVKAAEDTSSARWIRDYIHKNKEYYLSPDEMFARAYAQYVALKSGDPEVLAELEKALTDNRQRWKHWVKSDWIPIEEAITKALKRRTWL